jgi:uncharacterized protein YmfQ (DUF2313 family)
MGMTEGDYLQQLVALLPRGPAWSADDDAVLLERLKGWAATMARVDGRAGDLLAEADPRSTSELLPDWERVAGLPDACELAFGVVGTETQRRFALLARLVSGGGLSVPYFQSVISALGYVATITEFTETTVDDDVDAPIVGESWAAAWQVNLASVTLIQRTVDDDVECVLARLNRAGATLVFNYA